MSFAMQHCQDDVEAYIFAPHQQEGCPLCMSLETTGTLRACLAQQCQCSHRAGMHAGLHPHRYLASGCLAFHHQKGLPYAFD